MVFTLVPDGVWWQVCVTIVADIEVCLCRCGTKLSKSNGILIFNMIKSNPNEA